MSAYTVVVLAGTVVLASYGICMGDQFCVLMPTVAVQKPRDGCPGVSDINPHLCPTVSIHKSGTPTEGKSIKCGIS